ncbi:hypothetical protein TKK_0001383 [Trichogramma kaykai]|uniref:BDBT FKBP like N-terminal domain-containing protein n=1 Tax=Trichogramma kaykai TaxID=54128 RepID=A0ABD2WSQ8_9HYME
MSTWTSKDEKVSKEILVPGYFSKRPSHLCVCTLIISSPKINDKTGEQAVNAIKNDLHSQIINGEEKKEVVIDKTYSIVDILIERAILTMSLNEKSLITVKVQNDDMGISVVSLEVIVENIVYYKPIWEWKSEEKYKIALEHKQIGIKLFQEKRYVDAFHAFSKACKIILTLEPIENDEPLINELLNLKLVLFNNMAECQLIKQNYDHAVTLCTKVLNKEENNVKALYRRGVSYGGLRDFEKAISDLKKILNFDSKNKLAKEKLSIYNEQWQKSVKGYDNIVRKMFGA